MTVQEWVEAYGRAWRDKDCERRRRSLHGGRRVPFEPVPRAGVGSDAIRGYWERATSTQEWAEVRMGAPFVEGDLVAVEWWTTMVDDGVQITLPGCLLLRFAPDGRCQTLREYWHLEPGLHDPHPGWGE